MIFIKAPSSAPLYLILVGFDLGRFRSVRLKL
jgi:hypothetical protein